MRNGKRHLVRLATVLLALTALVPTAQASTGYGRGYSNGIAGQDDAISSSASVVSAGARVSPDVRAFSPGVPEPLVLEPPTAVQAQQFDWDDALIGGTIGLAAAMLGAGGVALVMRRRASLRAA
jgi:hypothetical protein